MDGKPVDKNAGVVPPQNLQVYFGLRYDSDRPIDKSKLRNVIGVIGHPEFMQIGADGRGVYGHDIALLRLSQAAPARYKPAKALLDTNMITADAALKIAGFGTIYAPGDEREPRAQTLRSFDTMVLRPLDLSSPRFVNHIQLYRSYDLPWLKEKFDRGSDEKKRTMIVNFIEQFMQVVHPSIDEEMHCFSLDFFKPKA
jgi:hypothetical protein